MTENISKSTAIRVGVQDDHFLQKKQISYLPVLLAASL